MGWSVNLSRGWIDTPPSLEVRAFEVLAKLSDDSRLFGEELPDRVLGVPLHRVATQRGDPGGAARAEEAVGEGAQRLVHRRCDLLVGDERPHQRAGVVIDR